MGKPYSLIFSAAIQPCNSHRNNSTTEFGISVLHMTKPFHQVGDFFCNLTPRHCQIIAVQMLCLQPLTYADLSSQLGVHLENLKHMKQVNMFPAQRNRTCHGIGRIPASIMVCVKLI